MEFSIVLTGLCSLGPAACVLELTLKLQNLPPETHEKSNKQEITIKMSSLRFRPRLIPAPLLGRMTAEGSLIQPGCSSVGLNHKCASALGVCLVLYF